MEISIHSLLEGSERATGTVAIIDVFRAFTTAAVALANGASKIVMVGPVEEALDSTRENGRQEESTIVALRSGGE
jgi:2-phosphosulfolactate phosphatase